MEEKVYNMILQEHQLIMLVEVEVALILLAM